MKSNKKIMKLGQTLASLILIGLIVFSFFYYQRFAYFSSEIGVDVVNKKRVEKIYKISYSGKVHKIDYAPSESKKSLTLMKIYFSDSFWVTPLGQYHNLKYLKKGDSIRKDSQSLAIEVFPYYKSDSSFILQADSISLKFLED